MYVDGYVLPVPKDQVEQYRKLAREAGAVWREHGALQYCEAVGEDLDVKDVEPFPRRMELKPDETVVFAWVTFASRAERDRINALVMEDPRIKASMTTQQMPFDTRRMVYGGFEVIVEA